MKVRETGKRYCNISQFSQNFILAVAALVVPPLGGICDREPPPRA